MYLESFLVHNLTVRLLVHQSYSLHADIVGPATFSLCIIIACCITHLYPYTCYVVVMELNKIPSDDKKYPNMVKQHVSCTAEKKCKALKISNFHEEWLAVHLSCTYMYFIVHVNATNMFISISINKHVVFKHCKFHVPTVYMYMYVCTWPAVRC